jgi:hypothetical protein
VVAITSAPSRTMRSRPARKRSTLIVSIARRSAALSLAKAGIIAIMPPISLAASIFVLPVRSNVVPR